MARITSSEYYARASTYSAAAFADAEDIAHGPAVMRPQRHWHVPCKIGLRCRTLPVPCLCLMTMTILAQPSQRRGTTRVSPPSRPANGQHAPELIHGSLRPCLIVLDLMMPVRSGEDFRGGQLADPDLAAIPLLVYSARRCHRCLKRRSGPGLCRGALCMAGLRHDLKTVAARLRVAAVLRETG